MTTIAQYRVTIEWEGDSPEIAETKALRLIEAIYEYVPWVEILHRDAVRGGFDYRITCQECGASSPDSPDDIEHNAPCVT